MQTVRVGQTVVVWVDVAVDADSWTDGTARGTTDEPVSYRWKGGSVARFTTATNGRFATWQAPNRQGTYSISCEINDGTHPPFNRDKRDDTLVTLKTSVRVVSGAPIWLESDIERSYQRGSSGRRVKMPDGAVQAKTVHSAATWDDRRNRWIGGTGVNGAIVASRRADGTSRESTWTVNNAPADGNGDNQIAVRSQPLTVDTGDTLTPPTSIVARTGDGGARMTIVWHKPYEGINYTDLPGTSKRYFAVASFQLERWNGYDFREVSALDSTERGRVAVTVGAVPRYIKTIHGVLEFATGLGSNTTSAYVKTPRGQTWATAILVALNYLISENPPEDAPSNNPVTRDFEMFQRSVTSDVNNRRPATPPYGGTGTPKFLILDRGVTLAAVARSPIGWYDRSKLFKVGYKLTYRKSDWVARRYDEHGYTGTERGSKEVATSTAEEFYGFYRIAFRQGP